MKNNPIELEFTKEQYASLEKMQKSGLWGWNLEETILRIIDRELIRQASAYSATSSTATGIVNT